MLSLANTITTAAVSGQNRGGTAERWSTSLGQNSVLSTSPKTGSHPHQKDSASCLQHEHDRQDWA